MLRALPDPRKVFQVDRLLPAGVFFVNLRGRYEAPESRRAALQGAAEARAQAYQHTGRFDFGALPKLDARPGVTAGDQFNYRLCKNGKPHARCQEVVESEEFDQLLRGVEDHLKRMGNEIYGGNIQVDPYRKGNTTACEKCSYQSVCRVDPWTHTFRVLKLNAENARGHGARRKWRVGAEVSACCPSRLSLNHFVLHLVLPSNQELRVDEVRDQVRDEVGWGGW